MPCGTATRTRPAPPRRAPPPHRTAAPDMPRLPATTSTRPKEPLLLSAGRAARNGIRVTLSRADDGGCINVCSLECPTEGVSQPRPRRIEADRAGHVPVLRQFAGRV